MIMDLKSANDKRMQAFNQMMVQKVMVANSYNKKFCKNLHEGDLFWKVILPIGIKDRELGKRSLDWEGPFKIHKVPSNNSY